ncbi:MAG: hypothetical protein M1480_07495 [Bacteroidetes bacterium]|nr:hypothetical protein [Bacteroidota bacterium]
MKKGCFVTSIVLFTLLVGVVVYLVKYKKDSFKEFAKDKVIGIGLNEFHDKLKEVKPSVYKDSLSTQLDQFVSETEKIPFDEAMKRIQDIFDEAKFFIHDKEVDSTDYNHFKQILEKYERPKKN